MVCYDGRTALDQVAQARFTMVILDLQLPDVYGTDVLSQIKLDYPETTVIILTGHGTEKDRKLCMDRGAHDFINKPLDIDQLVAIMAQVKGTPT